jgi:hypothetical protein
MSLETELDAVRADFMAKASPELRADKSGHGLSSQSRYSDNCR